MDVAVGKVRIDYPADLRNSALTVRKLRIKSRTTQLPSAQHPATRKAFWPDLMQTRHFTQLIAMSALWGASFPLLRIASPQLGPWVLALTRCALAAIVLSLLMSSLKERWPPRNDWPRLTVLNLLSVVLPFVLFNWAAW